MSLRRGIEGNGLGSSPRCSDNNHSLHVPARRKRSLAERQSHFPTDDNYIAPPWRRDSSAPCST
jgi:hypothetical protein